LVARDVWNAGWFWKRLEGAGPPRGHGALPINGREIGNGRAGDVMGNLLKVRAWLAAAGTPLRRGMLVTTCSMAPIQYPIAGDGVSVEVSELGTADLAVK